MLKNYKITLAFRIKNALKHICQNILDSLLAKDNVFILLNLQVIEAHLKLKEKKMNMLFMLRHYYIILIKCAHSHEFSYVRYFDDSLFMS